ncbi:MAG: AAA family ATPase, partial [Prevotellaceae bacterium]|nr:AAA family ATPase [Prevotellaceae bacterium]
MEIYLKQITLRNWKGAKNQSFEFSGRETTIAGANGTGKTTLFDAFVWVLFGKDHLGREDFMIKPCGAHRLDSEAEIILLVNGNEMRFRRVYSEV